MASLVLGAAGSIVGSFFGPLGASIGWAVGSAIGNLIDPQKVEGPRLTDLKVQSSQYGWFIPIIYGTTRVAGNVIFSTDLVEHSETSDGKGGPEVTTYSYTASFAVLICEGPVVAVTRVWADSRLVHDTTTYQSEQAMPFTLYRGTADQGPDPRMEAELGAGNVPAYRGYAYIMVEDLPLADYGNRIPQLTFEVTTVAAEDVALHITRRRDDIPEREWLNGSPQHGSGWPWINKWETHAEGKIVVKDRGGSPAGHDYDDSSLGYSGPTNYPGSGGLPDIAIYLVASPYVIGWYYEYCGEYLIHGELHKIYANPQFATNETQATLNRNPAVCSGNVYNSGDDANVLCDLEIASNGGIPDGEHAIAVIISQDKKDLYILTSPTYASYVIDKWYRLRDGIVVDSGTVSTPGNAIGLCYGSGAHSTYAGFVAGMAENNQEWIWYADGAGSRVFKTYRITDSNVLVFNDVGGQCQFTEDTFCRISVYVIAEGFCGVVAADDIAVCSRYPVYGTNGPSLASVVSDICLRAGLQPFEIDVADLANDYVDGYFLSQQGAARGAIGQLQNAYLFDGVESGDVIKFVKRGRPPVRTIDDDDLRAAEYGAAELPAKLALTRTQEVELPRVITINYVDKDTDYQQGSQYDERQITASERAETIDLAIAMTGTRAKQIAQTLLFDRHIGRDRFTLHLARKHIDLEPTDVIVAGGRQIRLTHKDESPVGTIKFDAVSNHPKLYVAGAVGAAQIGFVPQPAPAVNQVSLAMIMDLPLIADADAQPGLYALAAGADSDRWRGATLYKSSNDVDYVQVGSTQDAGVIGITSTALGNYTGGMFFDEGNILDVELVPGSAGMSSASADQVINGANRCVIGSEIVGVKNATLLSGQRYRLSGLLRGRYGTEWAMGTHVVGERFCQLPALDIPLSGSELNVTRYYRAVTLGQPLASAQTMTVTALGIRMKPLAPVHVGGGMDGSNNVNIHWTRRSRLRTPWPGTGEAPLGESSERYVLQIWNAARTLVARVVTGLTAPSYQYTAAMQTTDFGAPQQTVYVSVGQLGTYELGYEAVAAIPGSGSTIDAPLNPVPPYNQSTPPSEGTTDENHMTNFGSLLAGNARDRQLAWYYLSVPAVASINWYTRMQPQIIIRFFGGDFFAFAAWTNEGYNSPGPDAGENAYLVALAATA